jgi:hypothetical protein
VALYSFYLRGLPKNAAAIELAHRLYHANLSGANRLKSSKLCVSFAEGGSACQKLPIREAVNNRI